MAQTTPIDVRVDAKIARFERRLEQAEGKLRSSTRKMERRAATSDKRLSRFGSRFGQNFRQEIDASERRFLRFAATIVSAAGIGALVRAGKNATAAIAEIGDAADRVQVSVDTFETLQLALVRAGQPAEHLENALAKLREAIDAARNGQRSYIEAFDALGVSQRTVNSETVTFEELLTQVSRGLQGMSDETTAVAVSRDLFGRSGLAFAEALRKSNIPLERQVELARDMAKIYGNDVVRASQDANAELTENWDLIDKRHNVALAKMQPLLLAIAEGLVTITEAAGNATVSIGAWANTLREEVQSVRRLMSSSPFEGSDGTANFIRLYRDAQRRGALTLPKIIDDARRAGLDVDSIIAGLPTDRANPHPSLQPAPAPRRPTLRPLSEQTANTGTPLTTGVLPQDFGGGLTTVPGVGANPAKPGGGTDTSALLDAIRQVQDYTAALRMQAAQVGLTARQQAEMETRTELLAAAQADGLTVTDEVNAAIERQVEMVGAAVLALEEKREAEVAAAEAADRAREKQERYNEEIESTVAGFQDAIKSAETFKDALENVAIKALDVAGQGLLGQGPLSGVLGGLLGLGGNTAIGGGSLLPAPGQGAAIGARRGGGPVMPGRRYEVGEDGPEVLEMSGPGYITNAGDTRRRRGSPVNITTNIDARGAQEGVADQLARVLAARDRELLATMRRQQAMGR